MDRETLLAEARQLGLRGAHLMKDETLRARVAKRSVARVVWPNVWHDGKKYWRGDEIEADPALIARGAAEVSQ